MTDRAGALAMFGRGKGALSKMVNVWPMVVIQARDLLKASSSYKVHRLKSSSVMTCTPLL